MCCLQSVAEWRLRRFSCAYEPRAGTRPRAQKQNEKHAAAARAPAVSARASHADGGFFVARECASMSNLASIGPALLTKTSPVTKSG